MMLRRLLSTSTQHRSSEAVTQSATHILRQQKAAAFASAIAATKQNATTSTATSSSTQIRPLVGISSPIHRTKKPITIQPPAAATTISGSRSSAEWQAKMAASESLYNIQPVLSAASVYRHARQSGAGKNDLDFNLQHTLSYN